MGGKYKDLLVQARPKAGVIRGIAEAQKVSQARIIRKIHLIQRKTIKKRRLNKNLKQRLQKSYELTQHPPSQLLKPAKEEQLIKS